MKREDFANLQRRIVEVIGPFQGNSLSNGVIAFFTPGTLSNCIERARTFMSLKSGKIVIVLYYL